MPEISDLLLAYQSSAKVYNQAVSDLVAAEIRRDEAKKVQDEAMQRLEDARVKYGSDSGGGAPGGGGKSQGRHVNKSNSFNRRRGVGKAQSFNKKKGMNKANSFRGKKKDTNSALPPATPSKKKSADEENGKRQSSNSSIPPTSPPKSSASNSEKANQHALDSNEVLQSRRAGSKKAPKIFSRNGDAIPESQEEEPVPRRKSSRVDVGPLVPLDATSSVFEIARGRSRDWMHQNIDCINLGLVKKFYSAAFGTVTNEKTKEVSVHTIVLNDEWNELVETTSDIQEMYIGKSSDQNSHPSPRDRAALALVKPPQREPIALFFAPKNQQGTNDIFYGGHWKVIDGKMLFPPRSVRGQLRQCLAKFQFVGVSQAIVDALNDGE